MQQPDQKQLKIGPREKKAIADKIVLYGEQGGLAGCPIDQMTNLLKASIWLQPKQLEFCAKARLCDSLDGPTAIMYGGGRGAAKTHGVWAQVFADDCQRFPNLKCLILRKIGKANKEQVDDYISKLLFQLPHEFKRQEGVIHFPNGSRVRLGNFKDERDIDQYLGQEYDLIAISESNQLTFTKKKFMLTCLRTSKPGWRPRLYEDTNPGGVGMAENKKMYVEPWKKGEEKGTRYIHTTVYDNSFVNKEYIQQLETLQGWQRKAWLDGDWDWAAGSFFTSWREDVHVFPNGSVKLNEREIQRWFASMDYGYSHPNCFHLHCEDNYGRIFTMAEYHQNETRIQDHVDNFRDLLRLHNLVPEELEFIAAGADCFKVDKDGATIASEYLENGIFLTRTQIDRVNAWAQMQERLGNVEKGFPPTWFIHHSCFNLIQQIPMAQYDPKKSGDILKMNYDGEQQSGGDDALECCSKGTLISTTKGHKKIEDVFPGDFVLTREGWKRVLRSAITGMSKKTMRIITDSGKRLDATPNHPVFISGKGWKRFDETKVGDNILECENLIPQQKYQNLQESDFIVTRTEKPEHLGHIFTLRHTTAKEAIKCITKKFGRYIMARYQKVCTFIMSMEIPSITQFQISNSFLIQSTAKFTYPTEIRHIKNGETPSLGHLENQNADLAERWLRSAYCVERSIRCGITQNKKGIFAANRAKQNGGGIVDLGTKRGHVNTARQISEPTNLPLPDFALSRVLAITDGEISDVYNLTVEDCHEYFANGILVHNCARNGLVMAYSSIMKDAKAIPMGNYQSTTLPAAEQKLIELDAEDADRWVPETVEQS